MESAASVASRLNVTEVKEVLQPFAKSSVLWPLCLLAFDATLYGLLVAADVFAPAMWMKWLAAFATGIFVGRLFVLGHDACHGSFTSHRRLNSLLGRLAFLPSGHAFSLWNLGHNRIHHRFTNLRTHDYVWTPLSKADFDRLPLLRRWLERFYRSLPGHGFYYMIEIWWKKMIFPRRIELPDWRGVYLRDSILVAAFLAAQIITIVSLSLMNRGSVMLDLLFAVVIPFLVWNWLMGFVIFQHHTHPGVRWHDSSDDWKFMESQVEDTTHIVFPKWIGSLLHHIMEHNAHHALTTIPLYRLKAAQAALETHFPTIVPVVRWSLSGYLDSVRRCKLYDYERQVWLDFDGRATSVPSGLPLPPHDTPCERRRAPPANTKE
jgi:acyl-lipid omega-6 desaturase (Delta-12 desaturase)